MRRTREPDPLECRDCGNELSIWLDSRTQCNDCMRDEMAAEDAIERADLAAEAEAADARAEQ